MCPSPVKFPLLTICPCINNKLLKQLSTIKERWLRTISDMKTIGIVTCICYNLGSGNSCEVLATQ